MTAHGLLYLREIVVFLVAAGIAVPLLHRLRVSPVLGYLLIGALIGPFGLGLLVADYPWVAYLVIDDREGVGRLAELGVIFLLFVIGLDLSLERLWGLRRLVFGLGSLQIVLTASVIGALAVAGGLAPAGAALLGASLALSSTAIVMQLLAERRVLGSPLGRTSFAILLMQDLAVVPLLLLIGVLGARGGDGLAWSLLLALTKALLVIVLIYLIGRRVLQPLLRLVARSRSPEMFMAAVLLIAIGSAALTGAAGLSMALGAFLAGLLLAETEFRHRVEVDIEPFKGLLLGLFFMSVGMGIDYREIGAQAGAIAAAVLGLYLIKSTLTAGLCLAFGLSRPVALETGVLLGQGGELGMVILGMAASMALLPAETAHFALIVVSLSMLLTPLLAQWGQRLAHRLVVRIVADDALPDDWTDVEGHVVIAGYGRVGRSMARILETEQRAWVAFDLDVEIVARARAAGLPVFQGDAARLEILERAAIGRAAALGGTTDNRPAADHIVRGVRAHAPALPIYARARDGEHASRLRAFGASDVVPETVEASLQLAARVLDQLGLPPEAVADRIHRERESELAPRGTS